MKCPSCNLNYKYNKVEYVEGQVEGPFGYLNKYNDLFKKIDCRHCGTIYKAGFIHYFLFIGGTAFAFYLVTFMNFRPLSIIWSFIASYLPFFNAELLYFKSAFINGIIVVPLSLIPFFIYDHIKGTGRSLNPRLTKYEIAKRKFDRKEWMEAIIEFKYLAAVPIGGPDKFYEKANKNIGICYLMLKDIDNANEYKDFVRKSNPSLISLYEKLEKENEERKKNQLYENAIEYYHSGKYIFAIQNFEKYLSKNENDFETRLLLGDSFYRNKNYNKSIECFKEILSLTSDFNSDCYEKLTRNYHALKDLTNSMKYHQKAIRSNPGLKQNDGFYHLYKINLVQCPRCTDQYEQYDLSDTGLKILATCPHCGWQREFVDKNSSSPRNYFLAGLFITFVGFSYGSPKGILQPLGLVLIINSPFSWIYNKISKREGALKGTTYNHNYDYDLQEESKPDFNYNDNEDDSVNKGEEVGGMGSGFLISQKGLIITNYHVIRRSNSIRAIFADNNFRYKTRVLATDKSTDIAVLQISTYNQAIANGTSIPFSKRNKIRSGTTISTTGYPLHSILGQSPITTSGMVNSTKGIQDDPKIFQISIPTQPGNSGGIVYDNKGAALGIIVGSLNDELMLYATGSVAQNVNFAIKFSYIEALLETIDEKIQYASYPEKDIKFEDLVEFISPFTCKLITT